MEDKVEEVMAVSDDGDAGECDDGGVSPTPATVPKKRGRPTNSEKPKKGTVTASVRGRGRAAKATDTGNNKKPEKSVASGEGSDEGTASPDDSSIHNGDGAESETAVASKRGRKTKEKRKLANTVEATGKGRGRPKKTAKTDDGDDDEAADDNDDGASTDLKAGKKTNAKAARKGRGRPKKVQNSDDDESSDDKQEDYEERRSVGRPPSGGINLNIIRTGRGQGRPKEKLSAEAENGDGGVSKLRGRPTTSGKSTYVPTGKPRGRPKLAVPVKDLPEEEETDVNPPIKLKDLTDDGEESNNKENGEVVNEI